jgi:hypothetical protein
LPLSRDNATRVLDFLVRAKARVLVRQVVSQLTGATPASDEQLLERSASHVELFQLLTVLRTDPHLKSAMPAVESSFASRESLDRAIEGLRSSPARV